jgi:hypothetical protein
MISFPRNPNAFAKGIVLSQDGSSARPLPSFSDLTRACKGYLRRQAIWNIGLIHEPIASLVSSCGIPRVCWFPSFRGRILADPFALIRDGKVYILCEELCYGKTKGRIVYLELSEDDHLSQPQVALELPCHVSYPYLFEYQGEIYCVPETHQAREISLYKAANFPSSWTKVETLLDDFAGVDPTIFQHDGRWWLACGDEDLLHGWDRLFIWHAQEPKGPWIPHDGNPVKTDIHSSRPAGTPFVNNNFLLRPAQDCSSTYGGRVVLNRILKLTPSEFQEEAVSTVEPSRQGPYPDGLHTVSAAGEITLIDGKRFRRAVSIMLTERIHELLHQEK